MSLCIYSNVAIFFCRLHLFLFRLPSFIELENSLLYSQEPVTTFYPKAVDTIPYSHTLFPYISTLLLLSHLHLSLSSCLFLSEFSIKISYEFRISPMQTLKLIYA
jgi:hypothetical protein